MERSHSYTSFETAGTLRQNHQLINKLSKSKSNFHYSSNISISNINNNNNNNNNSNNSANNYYSKNKFPSTTSLNLRKALELRQTQLQLQQQRQQEQLQRQQWQLLFEQRRQQQQQLQQQIQHQIQQQQQQQQQMQQQLQHSPSMDELDAPLYLSTLNNLQLMQVQRQKLFQRQKSAAICNPVDDDYDDLDLDYHNDDDEDEDADITGDHHIGSVDADVDADADADANGDGDADGDDYGIVLRKRVYETVTNTSVESDCDLNIKSIERPEHLPQKLLRFQRQRPHSEAAINYPSTSAILLSSSSSSSPTAIPSKSISERHSLQALSFDSATIMNESINDKHNKNNNNSSSSGSSNMINSKSIADSNSTMSPISQRNVNFGKLKRDNSLHSDSSRYSSVDSLLEARKPDPEAILINLGFGPVVSEDILSRIPKRFLKPSQVRGIDTDAFIRRLQLANSLADHSVLGYRGLIGNPDLPPSTIVAKIMERFEVIERKKSMGSIEQTMR